MSRIQVIILLIVLLIIFQLVFSSKEHFRNDPPYVNKPKMPVIPKFPKMPVIKKPSNQSTPQKPPSQSQPNYPPNYAGPAIPIDPSKPTYTLDDGRVYPTISTLNTCNINVDDPNKCPQVCWDIKKNNPDPSMGPCKLTDKLYNCASC